jgi:hypothetical protein
MQRIGAGAWLSPLYKGFHNSGFATGEADKAGAPPFVELDL